MMNLLSRLYNGDIATVTHLMILSMLLVNSDWLSIHLTNAIKLRATIKDCPYANGIDSPHASLEFIRFCLFSPIFSTKCKAIFVNLQQIALNILIIKVLRNIHIITWKNNRLDDKDRFESLWKFPK